MSMVLSQVWLIDDDTDEHFLLKRAFARSGVCAAPRTFADSQLAVQAFAALSPGDPAPELMIVDVNMPGYDGWECIAQITAAATASGRPVPYSVLLSNAIPPDAEKRAPQHPALLAVLEKPLTAALIEQLLEEKWPR
jgi:CheY-like chemotaxis protein